MLKGKKKLDNYLTNWCQSNGFDIKCKLGPNFEYDSNNKTVYYSLIIVDTHDKLFYNEVCKPLLNVKACNSFILSLFHEIGHFKTESNFDDDEWCDYFDMVDKLRSKSKFTNRDYRKYYYSEPEFAATEWGCKYINKNSSKVSKLYEELLPLIQDFYIKNNVEA